MKKGLNQLARHKRLVNLTVAFLFFFSCHVSPVLSSSKIQPPKQDPSTTDEGQQCGYEELFVVRVLSLAPIISEMSNTLKLLHQEYPQQIAFWEELKIKLPETDPVRMQMEGLIEDARMMILSIPPYADALTSEQKKTETALTKEKIRTKEVLRNYYIRIAMLMHLQEKLGQYEMIFQSILNGLHQIMVMRWDNPAHETYKKIDAFHKLRKAQIAKYLKARSEFDRINLLLSNIERPINIGLRVWLWGNAYVSHNLAEEIAVNSNSKKNASSAILQELERIARFREKEIMALDAALYQDHNSYLWSILFAGEISEKEKGENRLLSDHQAQMATRLGRSLESMRPALNEFVRILRERNRLLNAIPLLKNNRFTDLRTLIALENVTLTKLSEVNRDIIERDGNADKLVQDFRTSALYEKLGFLKEELFAIETTISYELQAPENESFLSSEKRWRQVKAYLKEKERWEKSWSPLASDWAAASNEFKHYQVNLLKRYADALQELKPQLLPIHSLPSLPKDPFVRQFLAFLEDVITDRLKEIELGLSVRKDMIDFEKTNPLLSYLFGIRPDIFWHTYHGKGYSLYDHERLIAQKNKIIKSIRALLTQSTNREEQALLFLRIGYDFGIIKDLGRNAKGFVTVLGSGDKAIMLEGLGSNATPTLRVVSGSMHSSNRLTVAPKNLLAFLSPKEAYAGVGDFFSNLYNNYSPKTHVENMGSEVWKSKWTHGICAVGVVAAVTVGGIMATPAAAAVGLGAGMVFATAGLIEFGKNVAIGTTRTLVNAGNPAKKESLNRLINAADTIHSLSSVAAGGYNIYKTGKEIKKLDEVARRAEEAYSKINSAAARTADEVAELAKNKGSWLQEAREALDEVSKNASRWTPEQTQTLRRVYLDATMRAYEIDNQTTVKVVRFVAEKEQAMEAVRESVKAGEQILDSLIEGPLSKAVKTTRILDYTSNTASSLPDAVGGGSDLPGVIIGLPGALRDSLSSEGTGSTATTASPAGTLPPGPTPQTDQPPVRTMSAQEYIRSRNEREQRRGEQRQSREMADASRINPAGTGGTTVLPPGETLPPKPPQGPHPPQPPPGGTGTTTPTKTGETPPPKPPQKPEPTKPPVKPEPPPASTMKPSTIDFPDSSGRFKIMVHFPKGAGKSYKNEKVGNENVIVIMCPGYSQFVSNEPVELSVLGSGIGKWTVYANRNLSDPTTRRLLQTLTNMSSDAYYYVVIYDSNRNELSRTYFKVRGTK